MAPPSPFPLFLLPHLMNTLPIWYLWKGIFKLHLGVVVSWCTVHVPRNTLAFTGTRPLTHIINIPTSHLRLPPICTSPPSPLQVLQQFFIDSGSIGNDLRQNSKVY